MTSCSSCGNITFLVAIDPTTIEVDFLSNGSIIGRKGNDFELIRSIFDLTKFNYRLVVAADKQYGVCQLNGSCTGMVGMLVEKEAHLAVNLAPTTMRGRFVDFSPIYDFQDLTFVTREASEFLENRNHFFFFKPFPLSIWIIFALLLGAYAVSLYLFYLRPNLVPRSFKYFSRSQSSYASKMKRTDILILLFLLTAQGYLGKVYGCFMTSSATWKPKNRLIDTVSDIADAVLNRKYSIDFIRGSSSQEVLMKSTTAEINVLVQHMKSKGFQGLDNFRIGLTKVLKEDFALVAGRPYLILNIYKNNFDTRNFRIASEGLYADNSVIAYTRDLPCRECFDLGLLRIIASGIFLKWKVNEDRERKLENIFVGQMPKPQEINAMIILEDIRSLLAIQFFIYFMSTIICIGEHFTIAKER